MIICRIPDRGAVQGMGEARGHAGTQVEDNLRKYYCYIILQKYILYYVDTDAW